MQFSRVIFLMIWRCYNFLYHEFMYTAILTEITPFKR